MKKREKKITEVSLTLKHGFNAQPMPLRIVFCPDAVLSFEIPKETHPGNSSSAERRAENSRLHETAHRGATARIRPNIVAKIFGVGFTFFWPWSDFNKEDVT
jgi:hypothetical protein